VPDSSPTTACYDGEAYDYRTWASWLDTEDATPVGEYTHGVADGHTAVARREDGDGSVTTCGCWPGADLADALVTDLLTAAGVPTTDRLPEGVRSRRGTATPGSRTSPTDVTPSRRRTPPGSSAVPTWGASTRPWSRPTRTP